MAKDIYARSRHATQAYQVSYFGKPMETARAGYGKRLAGTPLSAITLDIPAGATSLPLGDLTAGLWIHSLILHGTNTGTVSLSRAPASGGAAVALFAGVALTAAGATPAPAAALAALVEDNTLLATVAGAGAGTTIKASLMVAPVLADWA